MIIVIIELVNFKGENMKFALIQCDIQYNQVKENQTHVLELLKKGMKNKPDVLVLPEMWNTGYALDNLKNTADIDGNETITLMSNFAKENHVNLLAGSVSTQKKNQFYNTSYAFDREGKLLLEYDKVHLFGLMAEDRYLSSGDKPSNFEMDGIKMSSLICYDIRFPEWSRQLMSQGSQILIVVAQWPEVRKQQWEILLKARAVENQSFVVAVNRVGDGPDDHFSGQSMVIDPLGNVIAETENDKEDII